MNQEEARRILQAAKYWHYRFRFPWGETTPTKPGWGERVEKRRRHFFEPLLNRFGGRLDGKSVLDLGCCQGWWSMECRKAGAGRVLGVDSCKDFVLEAQAAACALGIDCCSFMEVHLEEEGWIRIPPADITLFLGTLYHLADPLHALRLAASRTREVLLADGEVVDCPDPVLKLVPRKSDELTTVRSRPVGLFRTVASVSAIKAVLKDCGFRDVSVLEPVDMPPDYHDRTTASILALR